MDFFNELSLPLKIVIAVVLLLIIWMLISFLILPILERLGVKLHKKNTSDDHSYRADSWDADDFDVN